VPERECPRHGSCGRSCIDTAAVCAVVARRSTHGGQACHEPPFYKHFAEREQILAELFERLLGTESEAMTPDPSGLTGSESAEQQIVVVVEAAVRRMLEQEQLARFVYSLPVRHSALLRPGARTTPPVFVQVTRLPEAAGEHGEVRRDVSVALLARHVLEAMETAMRDWADDRVEDPVGHVRMMLDLAFQGVTKR